jgi:hypothetical protein
MPTIKLKIGTDHRLEYGILNSAQTTAIDITGWALSWMLKRRASDLDVAAVLTKTTSGGGITVTGLFNESPAANAQRARVSISDEDTGTLAPNVYISELKRLDAGFETILASGLLELSYAVHRA